jgi:hypothetical protein
LEDRRNVGGIVGMGMDDPQSRGFCSALGQNYVLGKDGDEFI